MKKWMVILLILGVTALFVVPAFADSNALTPEQQKDVDGLWQQVTQLQKQIIDKYVDAGVITKAQGDQRKEQVEQMQKYHQEPGFIPGGCGGAGGMMGGSGAGYGGMMGGYDNDDYAPQSNTL